MIIIRQNKDNAPDRDWDEFLRILVANRAEFQRLKILVVTDGGGPSTTQRKALQTALDGRSIRVAVVSDSMRARFIVSSIALLNRDISSFSMDEMSRAFDHLNLSADERRTAKRTVDEMQALVL
ncbi:MAG: hypothetical protein QM756_27000 [Polyangiaceae bacterium]